MINNDLQNRPWRSPNLLQTSLSGAFLALLLAACGGGDGGEPPPPAVCAPATDVALAPGASLVLDASAQGCLRFPGADASGAEYVAAALVAPGAQVPNGLSTAYLLESGAGGVEIRHPLSSRTGPDLSAQFHNRLRAREAQFGRAFRPPVRQRHLVAPPAVGSTRSFEVCADTQCNQFISVPATARYVGVHGAIYLDNDIPAPGMTQADIDTLGALFDQYLYPIDTTAFGRESDLDANGVVAILLTDAVNALSGGCAGGGLITGYFFGNDLLLGNPGSNGGEVFYGLVPDITRPACNATRDRVMRFLAPTLIHEFQHMISYHHHVLVNGGAAEHTWLNEGLSHYAEELGARFIPNGPGQGDAPSRSSQFVLKDLENAYDYLSGAESYFLVTPGSSSGVPAERGANWLFMRWLADHYGGGDVRGTALTRALIATGTQGAENVSARTGRPFAEMVSEWQLANFLDDLPGFTPESPHLSYINLNLRTTLAQVFPVFPLRPDTADGGYTRSGMLRAGSARHILVIQPPSSGPVTVSVTAPDGTALPAGLSPRVAVARIR